MAAAGIGIALSVAANLFAAHTARLKAATNENQAADILIPAFDADMATTAANFRSGAWTAAQCIGVLEYIDSNCQAYLKKQVGPSGTAWTSPATPGSGNTTCNKQCTVGCCIYYNDLRPAIYGSAQYTSEGGVSAGAIPVLQKKISGRSYVPEVYPPSDTAYGNYQRAAYWLQWTLPPKSNATKALTALPSALGGAVPPPPVVVATSQVIQSSVTQQVEKQISSNAAPAASQPLTISSLFTSANTATILTVVGGLILIVTALFGANALRVK